MIIGTGEVAEEMPLVTTDAGLSAPDDPFHIVTAEELSKPLPPLEYVIDGFIPKGSISLLAGYSASFKTWLGIAMALAVAGGGTFLGRAAKLAWALYLNYEHPHQNLVERAQQLARGYGYGPIPPGFEVGNFPQLGMDSAKFLPSLQAASSSKPRGLVVVDSLRAALRGVDENSSEARRFIDDLRKVSESSGTAFLLVTHARKGKHGLTKGGDLREIIRGSSAFLDAEDNAFVLQRDDEAGGARLSQVKCRFGTEMGAQLLVLGTDPIRDSASIAAIQELAQSDLRSDDALKWEVLEYIRANPGCGQRAVRGAVKQRSERVTLVIRELERIGLVVNKGTRERSQVLRGPANATSRVRTMTASFSPCPCPVPIGTGTHGLTVSGKRRDTPDTSCVPVSRIRSDTPDRCHQPWC